jgi:hypothetical protein
MLNNHFFARSASKICIMDGNATPESHPVEYSNLTPENINSLNLFPNQWTSHVPGANGPGGVPLFQDSRITWMLGEVGDVTNYQVLDLGPLEAGHTYMLEKAGADVLAIEGNKDSFLRCLIVKNYLNLKARFFLGDFAKGLGDKDYYDLIIAAGVLYHMEDPIQLVIDLSSKTDTIYFWTHFYEPDLTLWHPDLNDLLLQKWRPDLMSTQSVGNVEVRMVPQSYGESLGWAGFCGGPELGSRWIFREDLLALLKELGFDDIRINDDNPGHQNGPSFSLLAQRTRVTDTKRTRTLF